MRFFGVLSVLLGLGLAQPAHAQALTQHEVEAKLSIIRDLYNGGPVDDAQVYKFMTDLVMDDGLYVNILNVEGAPEPMTFSRSGDQLLKHMRESKEKVLKSTARFEITSFIPQAGNDKADVTYTFWQDSTVETLTPDGKVQIVAYESVSKCEDVYARVAGGIKSEKSTCTVALKPVEPNL